MTHDRRPAASLLGKLSGRTRDGDVQRGIHVLLRDSEPYAFVGFMATPDVCSFSAWDIPHLLTAARIDQLESGHEPSKSELDQWLEYVHEHVWDVECLERLWRWAFFARIADEDGHDWVAVTLAAEPTFDPDDDVFGLYPSHEEALDALRAEGKTEVGGRGASHDDHQRGIV